MAAKLKGHVLAELHVYATCCKANRYIVFGRTTIRAFDFHVVSVRGN